jgi:hypothetical protein
MCIAKIIVDEVLLTIFFGLSLPDILRDATSNPSK